jgi:hypothetical protein
MDSDMGERWQIQAGDWLVGAWWWWWWVASKRYEAGRGEEQQILLFYLHSGMNQTRRKAA